MFCSSKIKDYFYWSFIFLIYFACTKNTAKLDHKEIITPNHIISVEDFHLIYQMKAHYVLLQVSPQEIYDKAHIPSAQFIWRPDFANNSADLISGMKASKLQVQQLLRLKGINQNTELYLYDNKASVDAARFAWILDYYGFEKYKIINGGIVKWREKRLPICTTNCIAKNIGNIVLDAKPNENIIASLTDVKNAIKDTSIILVDTREPYEYNGAPFIKNGALFMYKKNAFDRGSIPSSIHFNWSKFANLSSNHCFKSLSEMKYDLNQSNIDSSKQIIVFCHSGSRSAHTYFVLKNILGYQDVKNYDGSWIEWSYVASQKSDVPIQKMKQQKFDSIYNSLKLQLNKNG